MIQAITNAVLEHRVHILQVQMHNLQQLALFFFVMLGGLWFVTYPGHDA